MTDVVQTSDDHNMAQIPNLNGRVTLEPKRLRWSWRWPFIRLEQNVFVNFDQQPAPGQQVFIETRERMKLMNSVTIAVEAITETEDRGTEVTIAVGGFITPFTMRLGDKLQLSIPGTHAQSRGAACGE